MPSTSSPESAARFIDRSTATSRARRKKCGGRPISRREALIRWAERHGKLIGLSYLAPLGYVTSGAEHSVYRSPDGTRAVKATHADSFGHSAWDEGVRATPSEYFWRLYYHNEFFGDRIRVEGIILDEGKLQPVISQPWIEANAQSPTPVSQEEIDGYFAALHFEKVEVNPDVPLYFNKDIGLLVADAHPANILRSKEGQLLPIDLVIGKPSPQLLARMRPV